MITNIDKIDARVSTVYPFSNTSKCTVLDNYINPGSFVSICLYCEPSLILPGQISLIQLDTADGVFLTFSDSSGADIGTAHLVPSTAGYEDSLILREDRTISGHMRCIAGTAEWLRSLLISCNTSYADTSGNFVLLPECHIACLRSLAGSIYSGDNKIADNVVLQVAGGNMESAVCTITDNQLYVAIDTPEDIKPRKIKQVAITTIKSGNTSSQTLDVRNKGLLFTAGIIDIDNVSDLRVLTSNNAVLFAGVSDYVQ